MKHPSIDNDHLTLTLKRAGHNILEPAFLTHVKSHHKADGSIVSEADLQCQAWIEEQLYLSYPDIPFLGEEMPPEQQCDIQLGGTYWCVDPLDGTSNFVANIPLFAISLALIHQHQPITAHIYAPMQREHFHASIQHKQARAEPSKKELHECIGFIDFKRLPHHVASQLSKPGIYRSQRNLGSCALEWAWLASGRGDFIIHGGENLWDYAAGSLLAEAAGCYVYNFEGAPLCEHIALKSSVIACRSPALQQQLSDLCQPYVKNNGVAFF